MDLVEISTRFRTALSICGITQAAFAREIGHARSFVTKVSRGDQAPSLQMLDVLSTRYGISASWVVSGLGPVHLPGAQMAPSDLYALLDSLTKRGPPGATEHLRGLLEGLANLGGEDRSRRTA